ncbi:DUF3344 domain-containing protein [Streptomyces sp. OF8]|uniref:DUF3344 domain-containing protein n=2 Tax=Streptomyces alkaliterrae TaxID=2213162 RepID=A0A5P0YSQ1_9ACTN|nr:DUF3344 domain-containing protein [Streptomyces alkaliterrae]MQS02627.1 DUF3344 domain-containing protein [Streptomyces alkaliterrae]
MRVPNRRTGRVACCALMALLMAAALPRAAAAPAAGSAPEIPFAERYRAVQHGGIARAANSAITCRAPATAAAAPCATAQGGKGVNGDYEMFYIDVDDDPNTYNSSRAHLGLPAGSRVSYARLYWGGNLRVGEQKPHKDNGRVLIAEPGGSYREVLADTLVGHRTTSQTDAYQASADVTGLVRDSGPGVYTVAQLNVAMGHSAAGAWGGWTLVVAYENEREPLRQLALWDGFQPLTGRRTAHRVTMTDLNLAADGRGSAGMVAYNGDRGVGGDTLTVASGNRAPVRLHNSANPVTDVMNSTISDHGKNVEQREPAYRNTLGYDSDVFDVSSALTRRSDSLTFTFGTRDEGYLAGVLYLAADADRRAAAGEGNGARR